ncbi:toxin YoeB [Cupriavidus agavae]|uniref:Putative mRNA interferase YoeB n=1 Tax=Cupriavidus agavae TaxID=1001822 RepID=A0A4Q7RDW1_9BURK|nr:toxin YoeB [Cupriavidus agavae]
MAFSRHAWEDYLFWQANDPRIVEDIHALIEEISRTPFTGTGKPEPLRGDLSGFWSRRISRGDRLVYIVEGGVVHVMQCRQHD